MLASLGCFFTHLSYSLRTARLDSSFFMLATCQRALAARKKRQGQNCSPGLIRYEHHQSRIVVICIAALFSQLSDGVLGMRKCHRSIWQVDPIGIVLDPVSSVYREEISRHRRFSPSRVFCQCGATVAITSVTRHVRIYPNAVVEVLLYWVS